MATEDSPESEEAVLLRWLAAASKGRCLCSSARVPLPFLHLLHEKMGLLLVDEGQAGEAFFYFKGVEKGSILVVGPRLEDFLVPYYAPVRGL